MKKRKDIAETCGGIGVWIMTYQTALEIELDRARSLFIEIEAQDAVLQKLSEERRSQEGELRKAADVAYRSELEKFQQLSAERNAALERAKAAMPAFRAFAMEGLTPRLRPQMDPTTNVGDVA